MKIYGVILLILMVLPMASAEIIFSQPNSVYSMGDTLESKITIKEASPVSDFFTVDLVCGDSASSVTLYKNSLNFKADEAKEINLNIPLTEKVIHGLQGVCRLNGKLDADNANSLEFNIDKTIKIDSSFNTDLYNPSEVLVAKGVATKANGKNVSGFVEIVLDTNISTKALVNNGVFSVNITLPSDYAAGTHSVIVKVYEKDGADAITNHGELTKQITINSVLSSLDVSVSSENVKPGDKMTYTILGYDQTGLPLEKEVSFVISTPDKKSLLSGALKTNVPVEFVVNSTFAPGYWEIKAYNEQFSVKKLFYIEAFEKATFDIVNNTLIVTNVGNIPYQKQILIDIGNVTFAKDVNLKVGASKRFTLQGKQENYNVRVNDGQNVFERDSVSLTGGAVGVDETGVLSAGRNIIWIVLLVIIALGIATNVYMKRRRTGGIGNVSDVAGNSGVPAPSRKLSSIGVTKQGAKEQASVVALKLTHGSTSQAAVDNALSALQNTGAKVYTDGSYKMAVFSKNLTGQDNNEALALRMAQEVVSNFDDHNTRMKDKIEYGVGLHRGELISEIKDGKSSFTSIGNLIPTTKRMAQASTKDILLSSEFYKSVMGNVKADKDASRNAWVLNRVIDRAQHDSFIKGFLGRYDKK